MMWNFGILTNSLNYTIQYKCMSIIKVAPQAYAADKILFLTHSLKIKSKKNY